MAKAPAEIKSLARAHTATAINVLKGIMNEKSAPAAARVSAASALLDRGWGKPNQQLDVEGEIRLSKIVTEIVDIANKDG